jgi:CRISPR-associated protein Csm1
VGADESSCSFCHDHILPGTHLVKKNRVAITTSDADLQSSTKMMEPIFDRYQVAFVEDGEMKKLARRGQLPKYRDISIDPGGKVAREVTAKFINGYVPDYRSEDLQDERLLAGEKSQKKKADLIDLLAEGVPKTFGHIANKALNPIAYGEGFCGIEALGALKADVDDLGLLMACGLEEERFTLARLATLSRQMNWFFAVYLPHLLRTDARFQDVYTVFAGGDDLFLIGP